MSITVIILTKDEEQHILRALTSVSNVADRVIVVDSGSSDRTVEIAQRHGAEVYTNPFVTQAQQFNWALEHVSIPSEWVLRLDADEVLTSKLEKEILEALPHLPSEVQGVYVDRRIHFLRRPIRWGGIFPIKSLRIFRYGTGYCEDRWMDEHIIVEGKAIEFFGEIIDDNLKSLSWWTEKHNSYASREVVDILNQQYGFLPQERVIKMRGGHQAGNKRWIKENIYTRLPGGLRAFAYFLYRYILRLGFLDGKEGTAFHVLQGFWYRYLVDMKLHEVRSYLKNSSVDVETAIKDVLNIDLRHHTRNEWKH